MAGVGSSVVLTGVLPCCTCVVSSWVVATDAVFIAAIVAVAPVTGVSIVSLPVIKMVAFVVVSHGCGCGGGTGGGIWGSGTGGRF